MTDRLKAQFNVLACPVGRYEEEKQELLSRNTLRSHTSRERQREQEATEITPLFVMLLSQTRSVSNSLSRSLLDAHTHTHTVTLSDSSSQNSCCSRQRTGCQNEQHGVFYGHNEHYTPDLTCTSLITCHIIVKSLGKRPDLDTVIHTCCGERNTFQAAKELKC